MPDQGTALSALQKGEQDWWEYASQDLLPVVRRALDEAGERAARRQAEETEEALAMETDEEPEDDARRQR